MAISALFDAGKPEHAKGEQGFLTENGIFLNRKQAAAYAIANGQTVYDDGQTGQALCSENLW